MGTDWRAIDTNFEALRQRVEAVGVMLGVRADRREPLRREDLARWDTLLDDLAELARSLTTAAARDDEWLADVCVRYLDSVRTQLEEEAVRLLARPYERPESRTNDTPLVVIVPSDDSAESEGWAADLAFMYERWSARKDTRVGRGEALSSGYDSARRRPFVGSGRMCQALSLVDTRAHALAATENGLHRLVREESTKVIEARVLVIGRVSARELFPPEALRLTAARSQVGWVAPNVLNRSSSAVLVDHVPSGLGAFTETERSQLRNSQIAASVLLARVLEEIRRGRAEPWESITALTDAGRARTYVLGAKSSWVHDHRLGSVTALTDGVISAEVIDTFVRRQLCLEIDRALETRSE
jgi:protein subunit release factor A